MSHHNKKGVHHNYHSQYQETQDPNGWVEGLTSLRETDKAVELLAEEVNGKVSLAPQNGAVTAAPSGPQGFDTEAVQKVRQVWGGRGLAVGRRFR
jgi:hypothetical protein